MRWCLFQSKQCGIAAACAGRLETKCGSEFAKYVKSGAAKQNANAIDGYVIYFAKLSYWSWTFKSTQHARPRSSRQTRYDWPKCLWWFFPLHRPAPWLATPGSVRQPSDWPSFECSKRLTRHATIWSEPECWHVFQFQMRAKGVNTWIWKCLARRRRQGRRGEIRQNSEWRE